jgi:membrane protease YdiL (CAAX protease family)
MNGVNPNPSARLRAAGRSASLSAVYWLTTVALALPIGIGFFVYHALVEQQGLREIPLHLEDTLLYLQAIAVGLGLAGAFVWVAVFLRWIDRQGGFTDLRLTWKADTGRRLGIGVLGALLLGGLVLAIAFASGQLRVAGYHWQTEAGADTWIDLVGYFLILLGTILGEELVFRGYVRWTLERAFHPGVSILGSALAFAVMRAFVAHATILSVLSSLLAGILLCLLVAWAGSLWASVAARLAWALLVGCVFSLPLAASRIEGLVRTIAMPGFALGHRFGPEGSALVLVLLSATLLLLWLLRGRPSFDALEGLG